jgi:hypothetical protein
MDFGPTADAASFFDGRARLVACPVVMEPRGSLLPLHLAELPFVPRRVFAITDVPVGTERGGHAHRSGMQLLVCLQGRVEVLMRVADETLSLVLTPGASGLLLGPGVWCRQTYLEVGTVLLALASEPFDPGSYVEPAPGPE